MDDQPPERHVETAEFAPVRVGGGHRRGWSPLLLVGWAALIAGAVGLGLLGQGSDTGGPGRIARGAASNAAAQRASARSSIAPSPEGSHRPNPVDYVLSGDPTGITISGTSIAHPVVWV